MNEQQKIEPVLTPEKAKRDLPDVGSQHERQLHADAEGKHPHSEPTKQQGGSNNPTQHTQGEQKPKTEQASHQGGGGIRTDHKPQGPGTQK